MSEHSNQTRDLLAAGQGGDEPSAADCERVRARLSVALAAGAGLAASGPQLAHAATGAGKLGVAGKLAIATALVGSVVGVGLWVGRRVDVTPPRPRAQEVAPVVPAPPPVLPAIAPVPVPAPALEPTAGDGGPAAPSVPVPPPVRIAAGPRPRVVAAPPAPPPPAATRAETLERETAALRAVRVALRHGDAEAARAALVGYSREFPDGLLAEEAGALHVETLCALGEADAADRAATSFLARYPHSLHAARVQRRCEEDFSP